eukprot:5862442-Prymnesium_polylepis.1
MASWRATATSSSRSWSLRAEGLGCARLRAWTWTTRRSACAMWPMGVGPGLRRTHPQLGPRKWTVCVALPGAGPRVSV